MQPRHRPGRLDPGGGLGAVRWSTDEDEPSAAVAIGAEDLDGDTLSFDLKDGAGPEKGAVTLGANGTFAYVPNANATGTDTFTIVVSDGQSEFEQVVTATIAPVNDAPNGALTNVVATAEDTASGPVLIGAGDLDGHALTYSVQSGAEPEKGTVSFDRDAGTFTYTPNPNATGEDAFTIVVSDGQGFFEQVVSATIGSVNDGPTVLGDAISVEEDGSFSGNLFNNDSDLDDGAVLSVSGLAAGEFRTHQGQFGTLKLFADGSYTYAADRANDLILGESGTDSFTYELSDGDGGTATGSFTAEVSGRDETMVGNAGADVMTGGRGADSLKGLEGPDVLRGHAGEDRLQGGVGDDTLDGGADGDRLEGGDGNDFYRRITSGDVIVETPGEGLDTVSTGGDFTLADGISIERIVGIGPADLTLIGNSSANVIRGAEGANSLSGGGADDTVKGGAGDDTMDGGLGRDCLGGGAGADTFQFADAIRATEFPAQDRVLDFSAAEGDVIDLSPNDARPDEGDQAFTFLGTGGYTGAGGEVRIQFLGNGARVMADVDGNRASDFSLFLRGVSALTADDFAL